MTKQLRTESDLEEMITRLLKEGGFPKVGLKVYSTAQQTKRSFSWDVGLVDTPSKDELAVMPVLHTIKRSLQERYDLRAEAPAAKRVARIRRNSQALARF